MANNAFTGTVPDDVYKLAKLSVLDLRLNNLTGSLSGAISALMNLR